MNDGLDKIVDKSGIGTIVEKVKPKTENGYGAKMTLIKVEPLPYVPREELPGLPVAYDPFAVIEGRKRGYCK